MLFPKGDFPKELLHGGLVVQVYRKKIQSKYVKSFYMRPKALRKLVTSLSKVVEFWLYSRAVSSNIT